MRFVSTGDNLHEMSNPVFWEKLECAVSGVPSQIPMLVANVANSRTNGQTDRFALAHLTMREGLVASLVIFCLVV